MRTRNNYLLLVCLVTAQKCIHKTSRPEQGVKRLTAIVVHPGAQRWLERL